MSERGERDSLNRCPACARFSVSVIESRMDMANGWRRRRRRCAACGHTWSTAEVPTEQLQGLRDVQHDLAVAQTRLAAAMQALAGVPLLSGEMPVTPRPAKLREVS